MATHAHVITMGLDSALNDRIRAWFQEFNFLPPIPLMAGAIDTVHGPVSFEDLLKRLVASTYKNFIIIIHGHEDGSGLYLKIAPEQNKIRTEHWDLQKLMDVDRGLSKMSPADMLRMGIKQPVVERLLKLMHKVRDKKIECIEFRSCNLGRNILSLGRFRQFLGARVAGAPDLHTLFGLVPVYLGSDFAAVDKRSHPGPNWETYNFPVGLADPKLVACFQLNALQKPEAGGHVATSDHATLDSWIKEWIMPTGSHTNGKMAMHGLWIADRLVTPKDHKVKPYFVPAAIEVEKGDLETPLGGFGGPAPRRLIPPLSANYKKHIVYSR